MSDEPAPTIEPGDLLTRPWPPDTPIPYGWQRSDDLIHKRADGTEQRREDIVILRPWLEVWLEALIEGLATSPDRRARASASGVHLRSRNRPVKLRHPYEPRRR